MSQISTNFLRLSHEDGKSYSMKPLQSLGFLGGGQLSRMLVESLQELRLEGETQAQERCLVDDRQCPVSEVTKQFQVGSAHSLEDLKNFFKYCDAVSFENEFVLAHLFRQVSPCDLVVRPELSIIETIQDKLKQKTLLASLNIPTARHELFVDREQTKKQFGSEYILKWSRLGYDGKGVLFVRDSVADETIEAFLLEARKKQSPVFVEEKIPFQKELAIVAARGVSGDILFYPPVETIQAKGVCEWVFSLEEQEEKKISQMIEPWLRALLEKLDYVGVLAMELFQTPSGLYVNELAPRVHNSAHYSQWALSESQFDSHNRAVLGLPLKSFERRAPFFGMMNLLGEEDFMITHFHHPFLPVPGQFYWYDKAHSKPGRKMGHVNFMASTKEEFEESKKKLVQFKSKLWESLKKESVR
ncbi:MAG: ATP-grasp domain-containing protein [Bdellovibrionales bacterium]